MGCTRVLRGHLIFLMGPEIPCCVVEQANLHNSCVVDYFRIAVI
jgi:hypothetical protein